jgi:hypothetical protein
MSDGSGARVNASTLRCIQPLRHRDSQDHQHQQHQHCDDVLGDCLPFELVWDPPETSEPADAMPPAQHCALDTVVPPQDYTQMPTNVIVLTVLFSTANPLLHTQYSQECCDLLQHAFLMPAHGLVGDLPLLTQVIATSCNFQVAEVTRVENKTLHDMHRQYAESYDIDHTRRVFHGTGQAHSIVTIGFRGAASKWAKFGRGIYSSVGVFQSLAYTDLTPEGTLTFVVAQLHLGPTGLGRENQVLFACPCFNCTPTLNAPAPRRSTSAGTPSADRSSPSRTSRATSSAPRTVAHVRHVLHLT